MKSTLMLSMFNLWDRMSRHTANKEGKTSGGMLERYNWFIHNSNMGDDCTYARKCLDLFLREDYEEVKKLFLECLQEYRKIEGEGFGK